MVAGGTEAALVGLCIAAFRRMGALSRVGESRPFDTRRDGFVMGEGSAVLVLEREAHARARGAHIYGRVTGYGASNDAFHITQPEENGRGAVEAMTEALAGAEALRRGALPPTLGLEDIDPECEADHIAGAPREAPDVKVALSNSFAFGGQNATLVLQAA
jgi:3-oxoacyl-(acyl-carrier-protein) synthase